MDVIEATRALGEAIQSDEIYLNFQKAEQTAEADAQVQAISGNLRELQFQYDAEAQKEVPNQQTIQELTAQYQEMIKNLYETPAMKAVMEAREPMDALMNKVTTLIYMCIGGEDPKTAEPTPEMMEMMQNRMMGM